MVRITSIAAFAALALGSVSASAETPPFAEMSSEGICDFFKSIADSTGRKMVEDSRGSNIGIALSNLLDDLKIDLTESFNKFAPALGNNNSAKKCRMGVDTTLKGTGSFIKDADVDIKTSFIGQCGAPYDLSTNLLAGSGKAAVKDLFGLELKNGVDLFCSDPATCKCGAITTEVDYEASFDEKKVKSFLTDSLMGPILKDVPANFDILKCIDISDIVTKLVSNVFKQFEGDIEATFGFFTCVNGNLKTGKYADFNLVDPMSQIPADLQKVFSDAGIDMKVTIRAVAVVSDPVTVNSVKPGMYIKLANAREGTVNGVNNGQFQVSFADGSVTTVSPSDVIDLGVAELPEMEDDNKGSSAGIIIGIGAGCALLATVGAVFYKKRSSRYQDATEERKDIVAVFDGSKV